MARDWDRAANLEYKYHRGRGRAYDEELAGFDPYEYMQTASQGLFDEFRRTFGRQNFLLRDQQVPGRLRSGFGAEDEERLFTDLGGRLNEQLAQLATQGAGLNLRRIGMGREHGAQALNLMTSQRELEMARRRNRRRGIGAGLGTLAGMGASAIPGAQPFAPALIKGGGQVGAGIADLFG